MTGIATAVLAVCAAVAPAQTAGASAPDFTLPTLAGDSLSLSSFKGHPVFLNFWATWCVPCRAEMRDLISAYQANAAQGLELLAVNLTDQERMQDVRKFVSELQLPFPVLLDRKGKVWRRYAPRGLPTSVFIDTAGVVRFVVPGPVSGETMERGLAAILPAR